MSSASIPIDMCANCGKGEENSIKLKTCTACLLVKYCSRECQAAHRPQHKKECKKRAAEIYDEKLFKDVEHEDCPICFLPNPVDVNDTVFHACCGNSICKGCIYAMVASAIREGAGDILCAYCRAPAKGLDSDEEQVKKTKNLIDNGNGDACYQLAGYYALGSYGMPQDYQKANELNLKAGELGCAQGYFSLGISYRDGRGVEVDTKKAKHFYELAAMNGHIIARHNLGVLENEAGNTQRALRHWILAAKAGDEEALDAAKQGFQFGFMSKDEYASTLRAHQKIRDEMRSDMREKAAACWARGSVNK